MMSGFLPSGSIRVFRTMCVPVSSVTSLQTSSIATKM